MDRVVGIYYPSHLPLANEIKTYVLDCGDDAKFRHPNGFRASEMEGFGKVIVLEKYYGKEIADAYSSRGVEVEYYEQDAKIERAKKETASEDVEVKQAVPKRGRRAKRNQETD